MKVQSLGAGEVVLQKFVRSAPGSPDTPVVSFLAGPTTSRPAWAASLKGTIFLDTTLGKINVAGAAAWEVVTSA